MVEHRSDRSSQLLQEALSGAPQFGKTCVLHWPATQQPPGQEEASQTQAPPEQCWPISQGGPTPQRQSPDLEHASARSGLQVTQAAAPIPQALKPLGWHVLPEQQPPAQVVSLQPSQTPDEHARPSEHLSQRLPATPQEAAVVPSRQRPSAVQQPEQLSGLQMHCVPLHCSRPQPGTHAPHLPFTPHVWVGAHSLAQLRVWPGTQVSSSVRTQSCV